MSLVDSFLSAISGLTPMTRTRYRQVVQDFMHVIGSKKRYDLKDIEAYMGHLEEKKSSNTYRHFCFTVLKTFYGCFGWGWWSRQEERRIKPKLDEPKMPYYKEKEMRGILESIASRTPMERAIIRIICLRPTRRIELHRLNREDYAKPLLRIKTAKGGIATTLTLDNLTCNLLDQYLSEREDKDPALFVTSIGRIQPTTLSMLVKKILVEVGAYKKGYGIHAFRRGITTALYKVGLSERELLEYGGWRTAQMVNHYIRLEPGEVDSKVKNIHPLIRR